MKSKNWCVTGSVDSSGSTLQSLDSHNADIDEDTLILCECESGAQRTNTVASQENNNQHYHCTICNFCTFPKNMMVRHLIQTHGSVPSHYRGALFKCTYGCSYISPHRSEYIRHLKSKRHTNADPLQVQAEILLLSDDINKKYCSGSSHDNASSPQQSISSEHVESPSRKSPFKKKSMMPKILLQEHNETGVQIQEPTTTVLENIPLAELQSRTSDHSYKDELTRWATFCFQKEFREGESRIEVVISEEGLTVTRFDGIKVLEPPAVNHDAHKKQCTVCGNPITKSKVREHAVVKHGYKNFLMFICSICDNRTTIKENHFHHISSSKHIMKVHELCPQETASAPPESNDEEESLMEDGDEGSEASQTSGNQDEFEDLDELVGSVYQLESIQAVGHAGQLKWFCNACHFLTIHKRSISSHIESALHQEALAKHDGTLLSDLPVFIKTNCHDPMGKVRWTCEPCTKHLHTKKLAKMHLDTQQHKKAVRKYYQAIQEKKAESVIEVDGSDSASLTEDDASSAAKKVTTSQFEDISDVFENAFSTESVVSVGHEGQAKWYCYVCDFITIYKGNMTFHVQTPKHQGRLLEPDRPQEKAPPKFIQSTNIQKDNYMISVYECSLCKKTMRNKKTVTDHLGCQSHRDALRQYFKNTKLQTKTHETVIKETDISSKKKNKMTNMEMYEDLSDVYANNLADKYIEIRGHLGCAKWYCVPCGSDSLYKTNIVLHLQSKTHLEKIQNFDPSSMQRGIKLIHAMGHNSEQEPTMWMCIECDVPLHTKRQVLLHIATSQHKKSLEKLHQPAADVIKLSSDDEDVEFKSKARDPKPAVQPDSPSPRKSDEMYEDLSALYERDFYAEEYVEHLGHLGKAKWYCNVCDFLTLYRGNMMNHCARTLHIAKRQNYKSDRVKQRKLYGAPKFIQLTKGDNESSLGQCLKCTACDEQFQHKRLVWEHIGTKRHRQAVLDYYQNGSLTTAASPVKDCAVKLERLTGSTVSVKKSEVSPMFEDTCDKIFSDLILSANIRYKCNVCGLTLRCPKIEDLQTHKKSSHHTRNMSSKVKRIIRSNSSVYLYTCDTCDIQLVLRSRRELQMHLDGNNHKKKLQGRGVKRDKKEEKIVITQEESTSESMQELTKPDFKSKKLTEKQLQEMSGCRYERKNDKMYYVCGICRIRLAVPQIPCPTRYDRHNKTLKHQVNVVNYRMSLKSTPGGASQTESINDKVKPADKHHVNKWNCRFCDMVFQNPKERRAHFQTMDHRMQKLKTLNDEREWSKTGIWFCSICNMTMPKVSKLSHNMSTAHRLKKLHKPIGWTTMQSKVSEKRTDTQGQSDDDVMIVSSSESTDSGKQEIKTKAKAFLTRTPDNKWYCSLCNKTIVKKHKHLKTVAHDLVTQIGKKIDVQQKWHCKACNITQSILFKEKHIKSRKHYLSLQRVRLVRYRKFRLSKRQQDQLYVKKGKGWHCTPCNVTVPIYEDRGQHLKSRAHKDCFIQYMSKNLNEYGKEAVDKGSTEEGDITDDVKSSSGTPTSLKTEQKFSFGSDESWHCDTCNITLSNSFRKHQHLASVQHKIAVQKKRLKSKGSNLTLSRKTIRDLYIRKGEGWHCVPCNVTVPRYEDRHKHLLTVVHKKALLQWQEKKFEKTMEETCKAEAVESSAGKVSNTGADPWYLVEPANDDGTFECKLCDISAKNRLSWGNHLRTTWHRQNVQQHLLKEKQDRQVAKAIQLTSPLPRQPKLPNTSANSGEKKPVKLNPKLYCGLCNKRFRSKNDLLLHYRRGEHKSNKRRLREAGTDALPATQGDSYLIEGGADGQTFECTLCFVMTRNLKTWRYHLKTERHVENVKQHLSSQRSGSYEKLPETPEKPEKKDSVVSKVMNEAPYVSLPQNPNESFVCRLCNVSTKNEFTWRFHLKTLRHKENVKSFKTALKESRASSSSSQSQIKQEPADFDDSSDTTSNSEHRPQDMCFWKPFEVERGASRIDQFSTQSVHEQRVSGAGHMRHGSGQLDYDSKSTASASNTINININLSGAQQYETYSQRSTGSTVSHYSSPVGSSGPKSGSKSRKRPATSPVHHESPASLRPKRKSAEDAENRIKDLSFLERVSTTNIIKMVQARAREEHVESHRSTQFTPTKIHPPKFKSPAPSSQEFVILDDKDNPNTEYEDEESGFQPMILSAASIDPQQWENTSLSANERGLDTTMDPAQQPLFEEGSTFEAETSKSSASDFPFATEAIASMFTTGNPLVGTSPSVKQENVSVSDSSLSGRGTGGPDDMLALHWDYTPPVDSAGSTGSFGFCDSNVLPSANREPEYVDLTLACDDEDI